MFIRFVVGNEGEDHRSLTGIITEARLLRDRNELAEHEIDQLEEIYDWLNTNLPCPPFETSGWPKECVSWFRPGAFEAIKKMWEIVILLREHDVPVRVIKSKMPGRCLYSDDFQIVVVEKKYI